MAILVLAHTPKRDETRPITLNDLAGSKYLANFADSIFALGKSSKDSGLRYIKQLKTRATALHYGSENVIVCSLDKIDNFLRYEFVEYADEREHLKQMISREASDLDNQIIALNQSEPNLSLRMIAGRLNTNQMRVKRTLERHDVTDVTTTTPVTSVTATLLHTNDELVMQVFTTASKPVTLSEIETALKGRATKTAISNALNSALECGDIIKPKHGFYDLAEHARAANANMFTANGTSALYE